MKHHSIEINRAVRQAEADMRLTGHHLVPIGLTDQADQIVSALQDRYPGTMIWIKRSAEAVMISAPEGMPK